MIDDDVEPHQIKTPISIDDLAKAEDWINIHHRMLCTDAGNISEMYNRIWWLSLPFWRRAFRTPPWLRKLVKND